MCTVHVTKHIHVHVHMYNAHVHVLATCTTTHIHVYVCIILIMYMYHIDTQVLLNHMSVSESTTASIDLVTQLSILDCLLVLSERLKKTLELSYYNILTNDMKDKITMSNNFHTPSSTPDLESLPHESLLLLISRKLDITGFSELVLSKVLKFLSMCIDTHLPWLNIEDNDILIDTLVGVVCVIMRLVISLCDLIMISVNEDEEESIRKVLYLHFNMFTCASTCTCIILMYTFIHLHVCVHVYMYMRLLSPIYYLAVDIHVHVVKGHLQIFSTYMYVYMYVFSTIYRCIHCTCTCIFIQVTN